MATTYGCDTCGATSQDITDWFVVAVQFVHTNPAITGPPGGRTQQSMAPDLVFDTIECRQAWCEKAGVADPGPIPISLRGVPGGI